MRGLKAIVISPFLLFVSVVAICHGQTKPPQASNSAPAKLQMCGIKEPKELEAFVDKFLAEKMGQYNVPGAVFVLVKDGKVFFIKGYGFSDFEKKTPVFPQQTIVRAYSVSKSFTATAVMQLVERRKLNLDEDVNKYLKTFKLKENFPQPVTLANLLTHTAGFVDTGDDTLLARGRLRARTLGEWLAEFMPPRSKAPDTEVKYSNFGSSLAGYIVEVASGEPYAKYMEENILKPLGMRDSSFLWPTQLSSQLSWRVAPGYTVEKIGALRRMTPEEGDFANTPAANLLTTAPDIARFMIAQLNGGRYGKSRILSEASIKRMHEPWKYAKSEENVGYGFFWRPIKNQQFSFLFHSGGWYGSITDMELLPAHNLGYFLWYNQGGDEKRRMRAEFYMQLVTHYFSDCRTN